MRTTKLQRLSVSRIQVFKLVQGAEQRWQTLRGAEILGKVRAVRVRSDYSSRRRS